MADRLTEGSSGRESTSGTDGNVTAVIVTHMRPRLTGELVRSLIEVEHFDPSRIIVVVSGEGGLDDPSLEESVRMLKLATNEGPGGGFRAGIEEAFNDPSTKWAYLCEDDVGLLPLPSPRVDSLLERVAALGAVDPPVGAVVAYGRVFTRSSGNAVNAVPLPGAAQDLDPVDVGAWGATLLSRAVADAGVLPEREWFFGFEDFDFFSRLREAGFSLMVDSISARTVASYETTKGRHELQAGKRPTDSDESWRAYYIARNFFTLAKRHGRPSWILWHLAYSARRLQLSRSRKERSAIFRGLLDGARGKLGQNPAYRRSVGELPPGSAQ